MWFHRFPGDITHLFQCPMSTWWLIAFTTPEIDWLLRLHQFKKENYLNQTSMTSTVQHVNLPGCRDRIFSPNKNRQGYQRWPVAKRKSKITKSWPKNCCWRFPGREWVGKHTEKMECIWFEVAVSVLTCYRSVFLAVTYLKCNQGKVLSECDLLVLMGVLEGGAT